MSLLPARPPGCYVAQFLIKTKRNGGAKHQEVEKGTLQSRQAPRTSHHHRDEFQRVVLQGHLSKERKIAELNLFTEFVLIKTFVFSGLCPCSCAEDLPMPWLVQQVPAQHECRR